ncbi:MAG: succinyl-CoA synthetase beta subunit, partial [Acidobacteriota bacterium]|nr:succinyl-CoA synthetase beta subunit [Acidobacteriota bacterium]
HDHPEKIHSFTVDPATGFQPHHGRAVAYALGLEGDLNKQAQNSAALLYQAFLGTDASQIEVNPLAVTEDGRLLVLDAKVGFDSNAMFRHSDLEALRDESEEDPMEREAAKYDLAYIKLDGNIGCMVNGAGLAMATMDIIKLYGGDPANFLDVGGGASQEAVKNAFRILVSDPNVKAVLINIFGGIARTDRIARGVVGAIEELGNVTLPVVVRLEGTNVEEGRRILSEAPFPFIVAKDMADAAGKVVTAAAGADKGGR